MDATATDRPLTAALLAVPDITASTLFGLYDLLLGARRDWQMLMHGREVPSPLQPRIVSRDGLAFRAANGVRIEPDADFANCPRPDIVVITDLAVPPSQRSATATTPKCAGC